MEKKHFTEESFCKDSIKEQSKGIMTNGTITKRTPPLCVIFEMETKGDNYAYIHHNSIRLSCYVNGAK